MLRRLFFTNFKSWPSVDLECGGITGLFGPNSSGKTSILQFLLLLKQTKDATDRKLSLELNGDYVELGTIQDAIYRHNQQLSIDTVITFELSTRLTLANPATKSTVLASGRSLSLSTNIAVAHQAARTTRMNYELGGHQFELTLKSNSVARSKGGDYELKHAGDGDFRFLRTQGRAWGLPPPIKGYAFPDQARTYFQNAEFLSDLEAAYESAIDGIFYLGPLRNSPQRDYLWARSRPTDVGHRGEKTIDAILAATDSKTMLNLRPRGRKRPFQEVLAHWLEHLGLISKFRVEEIAHGSNRWQARLVTHSGGSEVLLPDVGFGVSQVLPVITLLLYVPEGSMVLLEQPEIHLHPLAQANLADLLIYAAKHRGVQVLVESHSEHLLLRLQRRIAEEAIESDLVKLYFCDIGGAGSTLVPLGLDIFGQIENWPPKFMGDAFGEAAAAERARLERRIQANAKCSA
jgi:predicted ATPase